MKILLINQTFYPDVVATAQYLSDFAVHLVSEGHDVTVLTARRSYSDPDKLYPKEEVCQGIKVFRVWSFSIARANKTLRVLDALWVNFSFAWRLLWMSKFDRVVSMTTPPLVSWIASHFARRWKSSFTYWMMDINPDQAIQAGWIRRGGFLAWLLKRLLKDTLEQSDNVIVLDRFMKENVIQKGVSPEKIEIIPPWVLIELTNSERQNCLRSELNLNGAFVVMYSGNHSVCHPLDTALQAALVLQTDPSIQFMFVGGGVRMKEVMDFKENHHLSNIICLPYQERIDLKNSLSTADLHLVVMGNPYVGIVHPCKIYGILDSARPFVLIGPHKSSIGELIQEKQIGRQIEHGDVNGLVKAIQSARRLSESEKKEIADKSRNLINGRFNRKKLISGLTRIVCGNVFRPEG